MEDSSHRTTVLSSIACVLLLITAGCATVPTESSSPTTNAETDTVTGTLTTPTPITEPPKTNQDSHTTVGEASQTTTKGVFGSIEHELEVRNYLNESKNVSVNIETANRTVIFDKNMQIGGNSSREFDFEFPDTGVYTVVVNTSFANETRTWNVTRRNPTVVMSVVLIDDNELHVGLEAI